jgi:carbonic anhydrase
VPSHDQDGAAYLRRLEQASLKRSLENLTTFPFVHNACERKTLTLFGAYFDVATGELSELDRATGQFVAVAPTSR